MKISTGVHNRRKYTFQGYMELSIFLFVSFLILGLWEKGGLNESEDIINLIFS